jgi:AraC family transcriptional regulator of adaptative response / DNA-3-methyladenine glycosylase II
MLDEDQCWRICDAHDARFDGRFIVAVRTTRIYCRPSCPARPLRRNVTFFPTAAAAQQAGYRACKRCRPDAAPGSPEWNLRSDAVARAMRLIADGVVDRDGVAGLASQLGYSDRHLTRLMSSELGAGPLAIARAQRAQTARTLLETTDLRVSDVAHAAGFGSIRQFNDTIREVFASSPTDLRRGASHDRQREPGRLALRLAYRAPLPSDVLLRFLAARVIRGVESVDEAGYHRVLRLPRGIGVVHVRTPSEADSPHLVIALDLEHLADLPVAVQRVRATLDLDADPEAIDSVLRKDPALRRSLRARPGCRVPGTSDPTELLVRAVLGQQVSVAGARTLAARLVARLGTPVVDQGELTHAFPDAETIADADLSWLGMPSARRATVRDACSAIAGGKLVLDPGRDRDELRRELDAIRGIGPWTTEYMAMRLLHDPDAFPSTDLGVLHGARSLGLPSDPRALTDHAQRWQPFRAYAVQHLWNALDPGETR